MKQYLLLLFLLTGFLAAEAKHITGGEMIYEYVETNSGGKVYKVTLILFRDELSGGAEMPPTVTIGIFNNDNRGLIENRSVGLVSTQLLPINGLPRCITNQPNLSYTSGYYIFEVVVPTSNASGLTLAYQTCCSSLP
ncbi:MAG: hypothetical protein EOO06_20160 [Chitinophagaceae bacterium]|nr:MAG: hypothetical protein EOO06_20160 [Chitinophagaceae bacterium]